MKDRFELFAIFQNFYAEVKTQFGATIKVLRSDNATEYFFKQFTSLLTSMGTIHQSSCPYTPQQNGVAERKNRHLLEVARCLLLQMHVPHAFWSDTVLTACFLINRMPSTILNGQSPFSIIFSTISTFILPPRIFGCVAFVHRSDRAISKLDPRAHKCIFFWVIQRHKRGIVAIVLRFTSSF